MGRVIHFEIHAEKPDRAVAFYQKMFGWEITKWGGPADYWVISTGKKEEPGINGGLLKRMGPPPADGQPVNAYACTVDVPNLDDMMGKVGKHGGTIAVPKMAVPGIGWLAYGKDTEGNIFGMMQADTKAK